MPDGDEVWKLIGVYSTRERAEQTQARSANLPGFLEQIEGLVIDEYAPDKAHWVEGYVTISN
jgi:hypothetical protein